MSPLRSKYMNTTVEWKETGTLVKGSRARNQDLGKGCRGSHPAGLPHLTVSCPSGHTSLLTRNNHLMLYLIKSDLFIEQLWTIVSFRIGTMSD